MLLQAKALTTAADWAQAYAELAEEKDAQLAVLAKDNGILMKEKDELAKEKDDLAKEKDDLAKKKDVQLAVWAKENRILTKEKEVLAKQLSQCTALGNLTGARCSRLRGPLSPIGTFFLRSPLHVRCVQLQRRSMPQPRCRRGKQPQQVPSRRRDTLAL